MNFICCNYYSIFILTLLSISAQTYAQNILPNYSTANWKDLNDIRINVSEPCDSVSILAYGGDNTGLISNNSALSSAINFLKNSGKTGIVLFPSGTYLFTASVNLPDSIILKGNGATNTILRFVMGGSGNLINIAGSLNNDTTKIIGTALKNSYKARVQDPSKFKLGDIVKLIERDSDLLYSAWAYGTVGQIMEIKAISGDSIEFSSSMRIQYPAFRNPYIKKLNMRKNVGVSCLKLVRGDHVNNGIQYSNFNFDYSANCWLNGVHSDSTFFAHVDLSNSYRNIIRSCYFTNSYDYGGNGRGYGIACESTSSENVIIDNIFKKLRHSMLVQSGANGNVFSFNYSRETYWNQVLFPSDVAGDIVCHGNYPFSNLFEHNICQNIVIDNSHGNNGPYNLLFRNRAENAGIFMNTGAGDSTNFIGNEVTEPASLFYGLYILTGNGNFTYGNNIQGNPQPPGTNILADSTYYTSLKPPMINGIWPSIGFPNTINTGTLPSVSRYNSNLYTVCNSLINYPVSVVSAPIHSKNSVYIFPNPAIEKLGIQLISLEEEPMTVDIRSLTGNLIITSKVSLRKGENVISIPLNHLPTGLYFVAIKTSNALSQHSFIKE